MKKKFASPRVRTMTLSSPHSRKMALSPPRTRKMTLSPPRKRNIIIKKSPTKRKSVMKTIQKRPLIMMSPLSKRLKSSSTRVIIFGRAGCAWCQKAKEMFEGMGVPYTFIDILDQTGTKFSSEEMMELNEITAPTNTVPRIFVDGFFVGGFSDTSEKIKNGSLRF